MHHHLTPLREVLSTMLDAPPPRLPVSEPQDFAARSQRGMASATSMLVLCLHELDGTMIERGVARDITRRVVAAYLDQIGGVR